jgi:hypothetical protein
MAVENSLGIRDAGLVAFDGAATFAGRTITAGSGISISNGNGISGNPTISASGSVPITFTTDTGSATPSLGIINILGGTAIDTTGSSNNVTIAFDVTEIATIATTYNADTGSATPSGNAITLAGSGSIATTGSGSTISTALTGLTNHALLVGAGTSTITKVGPSSTTGQVLQSQGASADPAFSTATYPSTTTVNQILYSSSTNVVAGLATANSGVLTTSAAGVPVVTQLSSNGSLLIGSGSGAPTSATLTAGTGISVTNGANSITITATGAGFPWTDTSGSVSALVNNGYFITGTCTSTLPGSPSQGDTIKYSVDTTNILTIQANTGQVIRIGNQVSSTAGTIVSTARGDSVVLVYRSTGTAWIHEGAPQGNWTIT